MSESALEASGAVSGGVKILLRCEGLALLLTVCALYDIWGGSWWVSLPCFSSRPTSAFATA